MRYGGKACSLQKARIWSTKTTHFAASVSLILGVWVALWSAVVLVVRIGGVYRVTTYTKNLSSDFRILDFFYYRLIQGGPKMYFLINYESLSMRLHLFCHLKCQISTKGRIILSFYSVCIKYSMCGIILDMNCCVCQIYITDVSAHSYISSLPHQAQVHS